MKYINHVTKKIAILLLLLLSLFVPLEYKVYWISIIIIISICTNKNIFICLMYLIVGYVLMPNHLYMKLSYKLIATEKPIVSLMKNKYLDQYLKEEKDDFLIARHICYFKYNDCEYSFVSKNNPFSENIPIYSLKNGNVYHISHDKRSIYRFNKYLSNLDIRNKTIFLPQSKEDLVIYNYSIFKDLVFEDIMKNENKCKLLIYGAQNGWNSYKEELIKQLEKDNNECISNLLDIETPHDEKLINKEESKKDLLLFLKGVKYEI